MTPKRFPDRDEIAAVHAEADALENDVEGEETRRLAGRVLYADPSLRPRPHVLA